MIDERAGNAAGTTAQVTARPSAPPAERPETVPAGVLAQAERTPHLPAVVDRDGTLRYRDLVARATTLAVALRRALDGTRAGPAGDPAGPDPVIAVLTGRSAAAPVAQLAVWLCGAAFLPLDPALPPARIARILAAAGCRIAAVTGTLAALLPAGTTAVDIPAGAGGVPRQRPTAPAADRLAYLISTSGSTGEPKQVEVEHGGLTRAVDWYAATFGFGPGVRTATLAGLSFDASLLDLWAPLLRGGTLVLPAEQTVLDPERVAGVLATVDHAFVPTALAEQLFRAGYATGRLRTLGTGGDRLRVWPPAGFTAAVHNMYGPTEATILVTCTTDLRRYADRSRPPPIGRPIPGAVLGLEPVPGAPGGHGELVIAGPVVARGYRRPAGRLGGFESAVDGRRYRTGDVCYRTADGDLHFVGRGDGQVKVRGQRLELGEIELALLDTPGVLQAAAAVAYPDGEAVLVAWVVGAITPGAVRARLRDRLPAAAVPARVEVLAALPVMVNGKVDRAALRAMAEPPAVAGGGPHATAGHPDTMAGHPDAMAGHPDTMAGHPDTMAGHPDTTAGLAVRVAQAWQAVVGTAPAADDDFFLAGGDSLSAVRLATMLKRGVGADIRSALIYENRRFADLVAATAAIAGGDARPERSGPDS